MRKCIIFIVFIILIVIQSANCEEDMKKKKGDFFGDYLPGTQRLMQGDQQGRAAQELANRRWTLAGMDNPNPLPVPGIIEGAYSIPGVDGDQVWNTLNPPPKLIVVGDYYGYIIVINPLDLTIKQECLYKTDEGMISVISWKGYAFFGTDGYNDGTKIVRYNIAKNEVDKELSISYDGTLDTAVIDSRNGTGYFTGTATWGKNTKIFKIDLKNLELLSTLTLPWDGSSPTDGEHFYMIATSAIDKDRNCLYFGGGYFYDWVQPDGMRDDKGCVIKVDISSFALTSKVLFEHPDPAYYPKSRIRSLVKAQDNLFAAYRLTDDSTFPNKIKQISLDSFLETGNLDLYNTDPPGIEFVSDEAGIVYNNNAGFVFAIPYSNFKLINFSAGVVRGSEITLSDFSGGWSYGAVVDGNYGYIIQTNSLISKVDLLENNLNKQETISSYYLMCVCMTW